MQRDERLSAEISSQSVGVACGTYLFCQGQNQCCISEMNYELQLSLGKQIIADTGGYICPEWISSHFSLQLPAGPGQRLTPTAVCCHLHVCVLQWAEMQLHVTHRWTKRGPSAG